MNEIGLTPGEQAHVQAAADQAYEVLTGRETPPPVRREDRWIAALRRMTVNAPLSSLAIAFMLGVMFARRR
jgi:hypothetical protein